MKAFVRVVGVIAGVLFCIGALGCGKKGPKEEAGLIVGNGTEPQSLDPTQIEGVPEHRVNMAFFEGLVRMDPKTNAAIPAVAESWSYNSDRTVVTFTIRSGVSWSDGEPITADTFVESWLHYLSPEVAATYGYMPAMVVKGADEYNKGAAPASAVGIRAVDSAHFEVTLVGPIPYAIDMMTHYAFDPLPMHAIKKFGKDWIKPGNFVGNGPFVVSEWVPQDHIKGVKNEKYWDKDNVFIPSVTFLPIEDTNTLYQKYKSGEIDWSCYVPMGSLDEVKLRTDFHAAPQLSSYFYYLNVNHPILKDVRVRKALSMSLNRTELVEKITKTGEVPAFSVVPPMNGYDTLPGTGFDAAAAKQLLADAGYPNGQGFPRLNVIYNTNDRHKLIAEWVQQQWKNALGIDVNLANQEWATFLDNRQANNFEIARAGWVADYADPSNFLELFLSTGGNNDGRYNDAAYDALMNRAATMEGGPARNSVMREAEELLITRDQAIIPFFYYSSLNIIDTKKWEGWYVNSQDMHPYVGMKRK